MSRSELDLINAPTVYSEYLNSIDVDECATLTHSCDRNSMCTNTEGSFSCVCYPGFTGDGSVCSK